MTAGDENSLKASVDDMNLRVNKTKRGISQFVMKRTTYNVALKRDV